MAYRRVIPRDLFNEANLLKCYGQVYIELERAFGTGEALHYNEDYRGFEIEQDEGDGSLSIVNIRLHGYCFKRPLNSRQPYPLYLVMEDEDLPVFQDDGAFTEEMLKFLRARQNAYPDGEKQ